MKNFSILISLILIVESSFGQTYLTPKVTKDSLKSISISYNLIQACINEHSLYLDYSPFKHHAFGFSIGKVIDNRVFEVFVLSPSQNVYPGTVYSGKVFRINYSYVFRKRRSFDYYAGTQFIYRDMYYNNKKFRDGGDTNVEYLRNEKATVFGGDIVWGLHSYLHFNKYFSLLFNVYSGIGWRERNRNIDTYEIVWNGSGGNNVNSPPHLGNESVIQQYVIPIFGVKLGLKIHI